MYKVLLVDDEKIVRIALKTMIKWEEYGFFVVGSVVDGSEAMALVEKCNPDVIITDLKMPNLDGIELIKELKKLGYTGKVIVLSNYDDFEFVKQALKLGAMDYVLKITLNQDVLITMLSGLKKQLDTEEVSNETTHELKDVRISNNEQMKNNFFRELFKEERYSQEDILSKAEKIGLPMVMRESIIIYIYIEDYDIYFGNLNNKESEDLIISINHTLEENLNNLKNIEIISIDYKRIVVIVPKENLINHEIHEYSLADKIIKSISQYLNILVNIITTKEFSNYIDARQGFEKCVLEENMGFYEKKCKIMKLDYNEAICSEINFEIKKTLEGIIKLFEIGSIDEIMLEIDKIFEESKKRHYQPIEFKKYILKILESTEKYIGNEFEDINTITNRYNDELIFGENYNNCRRTISKFFNELYGSYKLRKGKKFKREIVDIIEYLNKHLSEKITLEMISEHMNMNGSYLCRMFKKDTGQSIFNCLTEIRIDRAVNILKNKDSTIKELAVEIGMEDQFYFNRVFKKKLGMSPTEFRKKYFENNGRAL